jgi:L-asparagine transporter-like permease
MLFDLAVIAVVLILCFLATIAHNIFALVRPETDMIYISRLSAMHGFMRNSTGLQLIALRLEAC